MILVGQYDSPYTRRVAVSLGLLGFGFEHDTRSVFGDFDSMRKTNPLGRVPSLILPDGATLIDSAAILDWLDHQVGPGRALLPPIWPPFLDGCLLVHYCRAHRVRLATARTPYRLREHRLCWCCPPPRRGLC